LLPKKYLAPFVCGFGAAVLSIVPGFKAFACCLIVPAAALFSLHLDNKINKHNENVSSGKAIVFGLLTGIFSAVFVTGFDILITYFTKSNDFILSIRQTEELLQNYDLGSLLEHSMSIINSMADDIKTKGFSLLYSFLMLFSNLIINSIFGMIGGLLGMVYLNRRKN
jgi:uncharacterized membrane protein